MNSVSKPYRQLTGRERRLILRLLELAFPGRDELLKQVEHLVVRSSDENGSLELQCELLTRAAVEKRVPTEGEALDQDGIIIHYLLHVVAGTMRVLEVYKEDSSSVLQPPDPADVEVIVLG